MDFDPEFSERLIKWLKHDTWGVVDALYLMSCISPDHRNTGQTIYPLCCSEAAFDVPRAHGHQADLRAIWLSGRQEDGYGQLVGRFPISHYLQWALKKGIPIPWLEWATEQGLLPSKDTPSPVKKVKDSSKSPFSEIFDNNISLERYSTPLLDILNAAIAEFFEPRRSLDAKKDEVVDWVKNQMEEVGIPPSDNIAAAIFTIIKPTDHDPRRRRG